MGILGSQHQNGNISAVLNRMKVGLLKTMHEIINHGLQIMTMCRAPHAKIQKTGIRYHGMSESGEIL